MPRQGRWHFQNASVLMGIGMGLWQNRLWNQTAILLGPIPNPLYLSIYVFKFVALLVLSGTKTRNKPHNDRLSHIFFRYFQISHCTYS